MKKIKMGTSKKGGKKKQLKNRVGGKFQLRLAPLQRQPTASHARTRSLPRQPCSSNGQLRPQPMLACSGQGGDRGSFPNVLSSPPAGCLHTPGPPNSVPLESGRMAPCQKPAAEQELSSSGAGPCPARAQPVLQNQGPSFPRKPTARTIVSRTESVEQIIS